jgi:hypothetical protein
MKQFKRAKVIMLPTKNVSPINLCTLHLHNSNIFNHPTNSKSQHLYIISDDEIKEGDWFIHHSHEITTLLKAIEINNRIIDNQGTSCSKDYCKKIIATTDTSLKIFAGKGDICDLYYNIPQPSQQFIEKYIESYNKGEVITDVLVEYEPIKKETGLRHTSSGLANSIYYEDEVKVNPKDNTITIKKLKDSWNREEVIELLKTYRNSIIEVNKIDMLYFNKWIEENL